MDKTKRKNLVKRVKRIEKEAKALRKIVLAERKRQEAKDAAINKKLDKINAQRQDTQKAIGGLSVPTDPVNGARDDKKRKKLEAKLTAFDKKIEELNDREKFEDSSLDATFGGPQAEDEESVLGLLGLIGVDCEALTRQGGALSDLFNELDGMK